jgi:hypothetical protein
VFDCLSWTSDVIAERNLNLDSAKWDEKYRNTREPFIDCAWRRVREELRDIPPHKIEDAFMMAATQGFPKETGSLTQIIRGGRARFAAYRLAMRTEARSATITTDSKPPQTADDARESRRLASQCYSCLTFAKSNRICTTKAGRVGLVPEIARPGDLTCVFPGVRTPLILRPEVGGNYSVIGPSYIHGVMAGELLEEDSGRGKMLERELILV